LAYDEVMCRPVSDSLTVFSLARSLAGKSRSLFSLSELSEKNESDLLYAGASTPLKKDPAECRLPPVWCGVIFNKIFP